MLLAYLSLVLAAAPGLAAPVSEAGARPVQIELEAPEGCAGADTFFDSLRSRTDRVRRAAANEPRTTLRVRLSRVHGQVVGELRMMDDRGGTDSRKVEGASCDEVVQALSLTAALALDPSVRPPAAATAAAAPSAATPGPAAGVLAAPAGPAAAPLSAPATRGASGAEPASAAATRSASAAAPAAAAPVPSTEQSPEPVAEAVVAPSPPASQPPPAVELALGPVGLTVLSGSFSLGAALAARKTLGDHGRFRPTLGLAIAYVRNDLLQSPKAAQSSLAALAATVCPLRWTASILTLQPCALVLGGWLSATGRGVTHASTVDRLWLSAGGSLRTTAWLGAGISLELEAGVSAPLFKRRFFVTVPSNVVTESPTISPIVGLGLTYGL